MQRQEEEEEEPIRAKGEGSEIPSLASSLESSIHSHRGSGSPLPESEQTFFGARFDHDFSGVRVHMDSEAGSLAKTVEARAFTVGQDVFFGQGEYEPGTSEGKALLAHELTHVVQQGRRNGTVWRQSQAVIRRNPAPWRYTPPSTVSRSIQEIQGVVGTIPDGVYGEKTRDAVKKYQNVLKAKGLYADTIDGKWGDHTEAAHVDFATGSEAETYNCAGLSFKTYQFHGMQNTESILAGMTGLSTCADKCSPYQFKFWYWKYDVSLTTIATGVTTPAHRDFHIVGGQTDRKGEGPPVVVSKNGKRPVEGPAAPLAWFPVSGPALVNDHTNAIVPGVLKNRTNVAQSCFCASSLP